MSAGCWGGTMGSVLGRSVGSTDVSPFIDPGEQV